MVQLARIDTELWTRLEADDPVCSVLWLIGDGSPGDLGGVISIISDGLAPTTWWGSLCNSLASASPRQLVELTGREPELTVRVEFPESAFGCDVVRLGPGDLGVWDLFAFGPIGQRLCAVLFREDHAPLGKWVDAAMRLSVVAGVHRWMRLASSTGAETWLLDAFMAEVIKADGVAITKIVPEMLRAGIALTGKREIIDDIEHVLTALPRIDDTAVAHSRQLGGAWPR